jgi:hypothetical protein
LQAAVEPETAGDPMSSQVWTRRSLQHLSDTLKAQGIPISPPTVAAILCFWGYSLKANQKQLEGSSSPLRDEQFNYIQKAIAAFTAAGMPVISVDTKKKELIGNFKNNGRSWTMEATEVNIHDFPQDALGRAAPYGIYLPNLNEGYVYVGNSADTSQFAVHCIASWYMTEGCTLFPGTKELLILADSGGSNSCRYHLWKDQLQQELSNHLGLKVTVCHYPTGCSKWNPIEHRLFGPISINWAGEPLLTFEKMLALIRGATNHTGLKVKAFLMEGVYKTGIKVAEEAIAALNIFRHAICPLWNYTIAPAGAPSAQSDVLASLGNLLF